MTIAQILNKMIAASNGNIHDIDHLLRVWAYARTIGELEGWTRRRSTFWRSPPSRTTLPARSAARNTATPMGNIRSWRALCWCARFSPASA